MTVPAKAGPADPPVCKKNSTLFPKKEKGGK